MHYNMDKWEKVFMGVLYAMVILMFLMIAYVIPLGVISGMNQAKCLENRYPGSVTTWDFKGYCTQFVDATEYSVPIEEVLSE